MTRVYGAQHDLDRLIRTHLFLICPNNSGSTYLMNVLKTSGHIWGLPREGQHMLGYAGPAMRESDRPLLWGADDRTVARFSDPAEYDWDKIRKAWYFQASASRAEAEVFATKSPPYLLITRMLEMAFRSVRFVFMVRDPYAAIEGIMRRRKRLKLSEVEAAHLAATHMVLCFRHQRRNIERHGDRSCFFTYEALCADPDGVAGQIRDLVPVLDDLRLNQKIPVKGMYDEPLRNMNAEQIARLSPQVFEVANKVMAPHQSLFADFGYALREG